jgi:hypothetical protein
MKKYIINLFMNIVLMNQLNTIYTQILDEMLN